jgi:hypothetical protein
MIRGVTRQGINESSDTHHLHGLRRGKELSVSRCEAARKSAAMSFCSEKKSVKLY